MKTRQGQGSFKGTKTGRWWVWNLISALILIPFFAAQAAYLEQDTTGERANTGPEISAPLIRPAPEPETPFRHLIHRLEVGQPVSYRYLTVFPLVVRRGSAASDLRTLDEALAHDWITLREQDTARVPDVLVRNESKYSVFLMAGEMIAGGRQNRILRNDTLLPPFSGFITIPVYCGEKARWAGSQPEFSTPKRLADHSLRKMAGRAEAQEGIWREIDAKLDQVAVQAPTRAYETLYEDREVDQELRKATAEFKRIARRDTVGAVLVAGNQILCCDLFSDPDLFLRLWPKISRSYALENVWGYTGKDRVSSGMREREKSDRYEPRLSPGQIRRFLERAAEANLWAEETPGAGRFFRLRGAVSGSVLLNREEVIHAAIFEDEIRTGTKDQRGVRPQPKNARTIPIFAWNTQIANLSAPVIPSEVEGSQPSSRPGRR